MILLNVEGRSKSTLPPHELQVLRGFFPYALKVSVVQIDVQALVGRSGGVDASGRHSRVAWAKRYQKEGKIEAVWSKASAQGGGGIANVDSLEELDAIMVEWPLAGLFKAHIVPITDLKASAERSKRVLQARLNALSRAK
jgi:muconolactone delta-isomerase